MDSKGNDKKRPYEPPRIYELDVDMTQAMGQSLCRTGSFAAGACDNGAQASGSCQNGAQAGVECDRGSSGRPPVVIPCTMGSTPSV
ncbi:MAG: hypothetical protein JW821_10895 [Deltaproteobacteria bacterium]|nr:hypothetical protein [Deltaproteobacteria bacterium]